MAEKGFWQNQMAKVKAGESPALTQEQQQEREKPELAMQEVKAPANEGVGISDVAKAAASGVTGWAESTSEIIQTPEMRRAAATSAPGMLLSLADYVPVIRDALVSGKRQTQEQFRETQEGIRSSMSVTARKQLEGELINDNLEFTDNATKLSTWILKGTETIARMVPDLIAGGLGGKALYKGAYDIALANGIAKGLTPEGAKIAANKIANAAMMAPTAVASTVSAQGGSGVQVREVIENLPWRDLSQSESFKEAFLNIDEDPNNDGMTSKQKLNLARTITAEKASKDIMQDPALMTVNALASFIGDATLGRIVAGKLSGGIAKKALSGVAAEAPTEAAQGAMEQYAQNLTLIDIAGQDIDPMKGVAKNAVESGVMGAAIGGGLGAGGGVVDKVTGRPSQPVDELVDLEPEQEAPPIIPEEVAKVDRSNMTVPERRAALEASLDLQRANMDKKRVESGAGDIQERLSRPFSPTPQELVIGAKRESGPTPGELEYREQADLEYLQNAKEAKIPAAMKGKPNASKMMNNGYRKALSDFGGLSGRIAKVTEPSGQTDTMSEALAKMGGLSRSAAQSEGFDPAMFKGSKTFSAKGKMSFDDAAESLHELGFTNREGKQLDSNDVVEMLYGEANNEESHYSSLADAEMLTGDAQMVKSWAKQLGGTDKLNIAVNKALNNEPLGKRQAEVVEDMLDTINVMRTEGAEQAKEKLESNRTLRAEKRVNDFNTLMKDATGSDAHLADSQSYSDMLNEMPDHYNEEQVILDELVSTAGDTDFEATTSIIEQYEAGKVSLPSLLAKLSDISEQRVTTYAEAKPAIQKANQPTTQQLEGITSERVSPSETTQGTTAGAKPVTEESLPKTESNLLKTEETVPVVENTLPKAEETLPEVIPAVKQSGIASDIAGAKIDKEWTAFAKKTKTLNIPRSEMPQIKAEHRGALVNFMKGKGVTHETKTVSADTLKPTQAEFSQAKVKKAMGYEGGDRSILISSDNYVLDGHHQWLAKREAGEEIKVIQLDSPIADLIPLAKEFPSSEVQAGSSDIQPKKRKTFGWDRVELSKNYTGEELNQWITDLTNDPDNRNKSGGVNMYDKATTKKIDDLSWAVTYLIQQGKESNKTTQVEDEAVSKAKIEELRKKPKKPLSEVIESVSDGSLTDKDRVPNKGNKDLDIIDKIKDVITSRLQTNKDAGIKKPSLKGVRADYIKAGLSNKVINDVLSRTDGYTDISALESDVKSSASQDKPKPVKAVEAKDLDDLDIDLGTAFGRDRTWGQLTDNERSASRIRQAMSSTGPRNQYENVDDYIKDIVASVEHGYHGSNYGKGRNVVSDLQLKVGREVFKISGITEANVLKLNPAPNVSETLEVNESSENERVLNLVQKEVSSGFEAKNNNDLKIIGAKAFGLSKPSDVTASQLKIIQEAFETVSVVARRKRIGAVLSLGNGSLKAIKSAYDIAVNDYKSQPNLDVRTAKSSDLQAYSTPTPMALLANLGAGIDSLSTVYEPTAGNGLLLITANPKLTMANELDPVRASSLAWTGYNVTVNDATANNIGTKVDAVIANPPFGPMPKNDNGERPVVTFNDYSGKLVTLKEIDHVIAHNALEAMKDDGRATLIIGANMKEPGVFKGNQKAFLNWLYSNYSVKLHVEVDGSLYTGQGAGFPTQMIVIGGRVRTGTGMFAPIKGVVNRVKSWSELYEKFSDASLLSSDSNKFNGRAKSNGTVSDNKGGNTDLRSSDSKPRVEPRNDDIGSKRDREAGLIKSDGIGRTRPEPIGKPTDGSIASQPDIKSTGLVEQKGVRGSKPDSKANVESANADELPLASNKNLKGNTAPVKVDTKVDKANEFQAHYKTASGGFNDKVLTPSNMASSIQSALIDIGVRHGSVDNYVTDKLGYSDKEEMYSAFMALQADAVALAIDNIEKGRAIIIGDQTGVGKGRQAAGIIRYAMQQGKIPVFISQKPNLFTDMHDDLADIGVKNFTPLIMNNDKGFVSKGGEKLFNHTDAKRKALLSKVTPDGLPEGYDGLFLTYSQISSDKSGLKSGLLGKIAENAILIMDESHSAAGQSKSGEIFQDLVLRSHGVTYLSATYAKRPDNMMLYMRTDLGLATDSKQALLDAISSGGLGMQTYIAGKLSEAGQMVRRERSFDGINIKNRVIEDKGGKTAQSFDKATTVLRTIQDMSAMWAQYVETSLKDYIQQKHGLDTSVGGNKADSNINVTSFSSVVHNNISQLSLGLKAKEAGLAAIEAIKQGKRPVIALDNTLGSALQSYMNNNALSIGGNASNMSYGTVLKNALDGVLAYSVKEPGEKKGIKVRMPINKVNDPIIQQLYSRALQEIKAMGSESIPGSPIDAIRHEITSAGYKVAEVTGRNIMIDYADNNKIIPRPANEMDRRAVIDRFNDGSLDVLILNQAGSTGLSLHSSEKFSEQSPRHMIVAQPSLDINVYMQMLGRTNRTGQVSLPSYENLWLDLPSEKRPAAVLSKKMSSLNANTSGNTESATSVDSVDLLNAYGDKVVKEFVDSNLDYLGQFSPKLTSVPDVDTAVYFLGKLAVLPVKVQTEVLEVIEGEYRDLITYLDSTGQNELNMTELDLDAAPVSQKIISEGKKGGGVFSDPVRLTKVDAKAIGRSPTWAQASDVKAESSQSVFNDAIDQASRDTEFRTKLQNRVNELKDRRKLLLSEGKDASSYEQSIIDAEARVYDFDSNVSEVTNLFGAGGMYSHGSFLNIVMAEGEPVTAAVVVGLDYKHVSGNPYSASKWKMKLMVADRVGKLDVSLSLAKKGTVQGKRWDNESTMKARFEAEANRPARESRYVITGNLVEGQALSRVKGQIKPITLADGRIIQAMVLPRSFDPADDVSQKLSISHSQASNWLANTDKENAMMGIANHDNSVVVRRHWRNEGTFVASMPKSVSKGKLYWGNPAIEAVIGEQAVKGGGTLDVAMTESEMKRFVKAMDGITPLAIKNQAQISNYNRLAGKKQNDFKEKGIVFNKSNIANPKSKGMRAKDVDLIAKTFLKNYKGAAGIKVTVFQTQAEVSSYLDIENDPNAVIAGAYNPRKNEVVFTAENLENSKSVIENLRHEILTHHGLMRVVGQEEWQTVINLVNQSRGSKSLSDVWAEIDKNYEGFSDNQKAEEIIAKISEKDPGITGEWRDRIVAAIVRALRKVGLIGSNISKAEIRDMIRVIGERFRTIGRNQSRMDNDIKFNRSPANDDWNAENKILREQDKSIWQQGKNILKRNLTPEGLLPKGVFKEQVIRDNEFEAVEFTAKHLVSEFDKAVQTAYKSSFDYLPQGVKNKLSAALSGKVDASIPNNVKASIVAMRQSIDALSHEYISNLLDKMARTMEVDGRVSEKDEALLARISENIGSYVNRSYKAFDDPNWFKKVPTETVNAARDYFVDRYVESGETNAEARRLSDVVVNEILKTGTAYDSMESFVAEGKLGAKDLSILMRKKVIDPEIRALLGEYDDPRINYVKSATKMGRLVWNERFLDRVLSIGMGTFLFEGKNRPANATKQIAGEQSETYSPLNGLWTFPEVEQSFKDALGREQMSDLMRTIVRINGAVKYGKTVLSPTTAARNFQSAMFFAFANGHFDLSKVKQAMASVRTQVLGTATQSDIDYFVKLKRIGVVYDTPYAKEMARLLKDSDIEDVLSSKFGEGGLKSFKKMNDFAQSFYAFGDDFWKIIGFENEKDSLIKAGMNLEGAELEAAKRIRNTYPTYSMTGKAIKSLSRFPLAGTFVSFPAEIVRTSINMVKLVASDIKSANPKMRALGYKRMAGLAFVSSAFFALNAATKAMLGVTDDEEEAVRDLSAPWQKNSTFAYVGRDEKGNLQYFDMSFLDPYGYFKRPFTAMMRNQPWEDSAVSALSDLISPFLGADIVAQSIFEVMANKKGSGGMVYNDNAAPDEQLADIAVHLGKTVAPGFIGNAVRIHKALDGQVSSSGKPYKMEEEMLSLVGWRMSTMDPKTSLHYKTFEFSDMIKNANRTIMKEIQNVNEISDDDLTSAFNSAQRQHKEAFAKMIRLVSSAKNSGMKQADILETLRRSGVSELNAKMLILGRTPPFQLSKTSAENAIKKAKASLGTEQANRVKERAITIFKK